jgi:hypothetical protein
MKFKINIIVGLFIVAFSMNLKAQCDHTDDFSTLTRPAFWFVESVTSPAGWEGTWVDPYEYDGTTYMCLMPVTNGMETSILKSPVFTNGCNSLDFKWETNGYSGAVSLKAELKQEGATVWSEVITVSDAVEFEIHQASYNNLNITGEVQLVISNLTSGHSGDYAGIDVWDFCITNYIAPPVPAHNFQFNVPKDATVFVGDKDQTVTVAGNYLTKHYVPFTKQTEVFIAETDTSKIWYYNLPSPKNASGGFNYRVTRTGKAPHVGLFKPKTGTTVESDTLLSFTDAQLSLHDAKDIDHDVNSLNGRNVADVFININAQGFLTLPLQADTTFQLIHTRNWQAIDTDVNNYFIEPDFHYTVVDENGQPSNSVITVSDSGLITPVGAGTAIVLVNYDAMLCHHTTNVGISDVKTNPAFFSALWPENTAVFVVAVNAPETGIKSNMLINEYWSELNGTDKVDSTLIDAELDVLYYESDKGSFPYTFKPEGVTAVEIATPTVGTNTLSYSGFATDSVTANTDGSYTVRLGFGRNIVKLISATGAEYQVITAKPVDYTISNITDPGETFQPGDSVSVLFHTLYHPCNKMSGIYNMSAGIQYTGADVNFPLILGPGQYTFASRAQEYIIVIPDTITSNEFDLTRGVLKVKGFGSNYGAHRNITLQSGVSPNLSASVRTGYFGSLPEIHIRIPGNQKYTVTAVSGTSDEWGTYKFGEISPEGDSTVVVGSNVTYTFTPNTGYHIGSVTLGASADITSQVVNNSFTIENIQSDTTITVLYAVDKNNTITGNDIQYWVGEGTNKVIVVVNWAEKSLAWGYKFDGANPFVVEVLDSIQSEDTRFDFVGTSYLSDITYTDVTNNLAISPDYVMYNVNENPVWFGVDEQTVANGGIVEFGTYSSALSDNFWNNVWTASITPVSAPTITGIPVIEASNISVYPNPFDSFIVLEAKTDGNAVIYDLSGKLVLQVNVYAGINRINTSALVKGVYVLKCGLNRVRIVK